MHVLNERYQEAIEEKYRGVSHSDIAGQLSLPKGTVDDWFRTRGVLSPYYKEFAEEMNVKRRERVLSNFYVEDEQFLVVMKRMMDVLRKSLERDDYKFQIGDFLKLWKMSRVIQGKPIGIYSRVCPCCQKESRFSRYGR